MTEGLEQAMQGYRRFLDETPETELTPEAMRRLADLQIEKQFGIRRRRPIARDGGARARRDRRGCGQRAPADARPPATVSPSPSRSSSCARRPRCSLPSAAPAGPADPSAALEAIALYDRLLAEYPAYEHNDQVLYQKARAYDELGRTEEAMETMQSLIAANPHSAHYDEVQFRRGEYFFTRRKFREAEAAYSAIIGLGADSSYYEFALYKLGWTLYKQEFYDEAQHRFMALLDYKVSTGYDFDQQHEEDEERRVADTFRVISLGFSNLGGPDVVREYFAENGRRGYEDRIYANLGEFYLAKLRYDDAAKTYKSFVALNPFHRSSPHFSMRVVEIYTEGKFPKLVLEAKKEFAATYGLQAEYWRHFDVDGVARGAELPEEQPPRPRGPPPRAVPEPGARRREAGELRRGAALVPRVPGVVPDGRRNRRRSTTSSRTCCSRTGPSARRRASTSAPRTTIPGTRSRRRQATPRSSRTARTSRAPPRSCRPRRAPTPSRARSGSPTPSPSTSRRPACSVPRRTTCTA